MPLSAKLCFVGAVHTRTPRSDASAGKQSFQDKCVPKLELGNEGRTIELASPRRCGSNDVMKTRPELSFPPSEELKLARLESLFCEWHTQFVNNSSELMKHEPEDMVFDGFHPHYFRQEKKVLFIGWESRRLCGFHYIDELSAAYRKGGKDIGGRHLNADRFHSRMLRITHGIMHGLPEWESIPSASEIGDTVGLEGGLSFATMNISKLSNKSNNPKADGCVMNVAHALSTRDRNFIQEELAILEPDIVITMNLDEYMDSLGERTLIEIHKQAESYMLDCCGHRSLLINTWHFAARNKSDLAYYEPICDAIRRDQ